jgi:hypothetical protein
MIELARFLATKAWSAARTHGLKLGIVLHRCCLKLCDWLPAGVDNRRWQANYGPKRDDGWDAGDLLEEPILVGSVSFLRQGRLVNLRRASFDQL